MQLSEAEIELARQNKSQFISLKYLDEDGLLKQVDTAFYNLEEEKLFFFNNEINLKPIDTKGFIDPFRSFPTTSFFCENIASKYNARKLSAKLLSKVAESFTPVLNAELSFWVATDEDQNDYTLIADPIDIHANLRSDIIATLEKINIKTTSHYHGITPAESVIGVRGNDIVDLADNIIIAKFIIANIADSYGLKAQFFFQPLSNLSLVITGSKDDINKICSLIQENVELSSLFAKNNRNIYGFELNKLHNYKTTIPNTTILRISLLCCNLFIPYLALAGLLLYNVDRKFLNNEILQYFSNKT